MAKTKVICFIGPDGSGKSTLAKYLVSKYKKKSKNVSYTWYFGGEDSIIRKLIRTVGKPVKKSEQKKIKSKKKRSAIVSMIYPRIVILDYIFFGVTNLTIPKLLKNYDVMIFDRFIYDPVIFMAEEFKFSKSKRNKALRFASNMLPKPDLILIIDVPAGVSYSRKSYEIDSEKDAEEMLSAYKRLYPQLKKLTNGKVVKIDNTEGLKIVKKKVLKEVAFLKI